MKSFVLHDESINTYGFRMLTSGANLSEFKKNPVMLLNHDDWSLPIGRWENIRIEGTQILADPVFDLKDERASQVADKVERGFIKAASIGAWAPEEKSEDPSLMLPGQTMPTVTKWTAREASICAIGANHNALAFYDINTHSKIDLLDKESILKLMDKSPNKKNSMEELNKILKLSSGADKEEIVASIQLILSDNTRLKNENKTLIELVDKAKSEAEAKQRKEAIELVDRAVLEGRINADGKEAYLKFFDSDFTAAKSALDAVPKRSPISSKLQTSNSVNLEDLSKRTWDELDKENLLITLKDGNPELYKTKFKERFGVEPSLD